jgi:hypothetical protein
MRSPPFLRTLQEILMTHPSSFTLATALSALCAALCSPSPALAARDEVWDVEEEVLAQMARMKVRKHIENKATGGLAQLDNEGSATPAASSGCGNLNIGNVRSKPRSGDQKVTVIVTGNVINANNRCPR